MSEQNRTVLMKGNPLTLIGDEVVVGEKAPQFEVVANDLAMVRLSDFEGKVRVIAAVPSLDTAVCDTETRKFNQLAAELGDDVEILTISMDLPFAQKRWCGAAGVDRVTVLSDHRDASFGLSYGVLIKELRLLARVVFVIDRAGIIRYVQIVPEVTNEPNYDEVLEAIRKIS